MLGGFTTGNWDTPISDSTRGIVAVKLAGASGRELWRYQADSSSLTAGTRVAGGFDASYVTSVTVDRDNDVLLVGRTFSSTSLADGDSDYFAMKLNGNTGEEVWLSQGGSPSSRESLEGAQVINAPLFLRFITTPEYFFSPRSWWASTTNQRPK